MPLRSPLHVQPTHPSHRAPRRRLRPVVLAAVVAGLAPLGATASTAYGDLNNFDAVNDTGSECHGFEIELDDVRSTDITYTYDWNHFGAPKIREDNSDPAHPRTFVRYEARKNADGTWVDGSFTRVPTAVLTPTDGHFCTDTSNYSYGCEHFGVGYYGTPTAIKYNWLLDDGQGNLVLGPAVSVGTPSFTYYPPQPEQVIPAQVVAVIPAPAEPIPVGKEFGEPVWVKVIKTTTHNANPVALGDLVSADADNDGLADWQNGEPDEVEAEWTLLQTNSAGNLAKAEEEGLPDDAGDGNEVVTRRYEFYQYAADDTALNPDITDGSSLDGETGEAMCDEVMSATDLHGLKSSVTVTDPNGDSYTIDCTARIVVGAYIGAQMAGFDAAAPLGLIDHLQDGEKDVPYTPRTVVVGGNSPYRISITQGALPPGMGLGADGVLTGTPTSGGQFSFTVAATDADNVAVSAPYVLKVTSAAAVQHQLTVQKGGSGAGSVAGTGIDCGTACVALLDDGTQATLTATPDAGSVFSGWSGACSGTADCVVTVNADTVVTATFTRRYDLTVSKLGAGTGSVSGNGIDCGSTCALSYDAGTAISLTATPNAGSVFSGWGGDCSGTGACVLGMDANHAVTATFGAQASSYTLSVTRTGSGTVTSSPKGISCGSTCSKTFKTGTSVTLTAKPARKHRFLGWTGACSGTALTCTVQMQGDRSVGANFN